MTSKGYAKIKLPFIRKGLYVLVAFCVNEYSGHTDMEVYRYRASAS